MFGGTGSPIPPQDAAQVSTNWPSGNIDARMANYLCQAQQKWAITTVPNAGGYPGSPYFKITVAGTDRALTATADAELAVLRRLAAGPNNCGEWISLPTAPGASCQVGPQFQRTAGPFGCGQQFRDAGEVRPQKRQAALAVQDAVTSGEFPMNALRKYHLPALAVVAGFAFLAAIAAGAAAPVPGLR